MRFEIEAERQPSAFWHSFIRRGAVRVKFEEVFQTERFAISFAACELAKDPESFDKKLIELTRIDTPAEVQVKRFTSRGKLVEPGPYDGDSYGICD